MAAREKLEETLQKQGTRLAQGQFSRLDAKYSPLPSHSIYGAQLLKSVLPQKVDNTTVCIGTCRGLLFNFPFEVKTID